MLYQCVTSVTGDLQTEPLTPLCLSEFADHDFSFPFLVFRESCLTPRFMRLDELDYHLPKAQIAQRPLDQREASRLLLLDRASGQFADHLFLELSDLLRGNELLVLNNARVIPARLFGKRAGIHSQAPSRATRSEHLSGRVEVLLTRQLASDTWEALF